MVTSFGKMPKDVKRCDGDGGEGAGGAFSATPVPFLPSESKSRRMRNKGARVKRKGEKMHQEAKK